MTGANYLSAITKIGQGLQGLLMAGSIAEVLPPFGQLHQLVLQLWPGAIPRPHTESVTGTVHPGRISGGG